MSVATRIGTLLGGEAVLEHPIASSQDVGEIVRQGLPAQSVRELASNIGTSISFLIGASGLNRRTMERRIASRERLKQSESDAIVRIARIVAHAKQLLGDERALRWLEIPNVALGGARPIDLLGTETDARAVEAILGRIEHGVFS